MKNKSIRIKWYYGALLMLVLMFVPIAIFLPRKTSTPLPNAWAHINKTHIHLDHSGFFPNAFEAPQDVTKACLECHASAAHDVMQTPHYTWQRKPMKILGHTEELAIGKKNLINNFCIGIQGNEGGCASCHAGYGWKDNSPISQKQEDVDCLVCHDWSGTYAKGNMGLPTKGVNLQVVAQSVGYSTRENCGRCHIYGGGGMGVKHGDLDNSLVNPSQIVDAHMSKHSLLCIDCHKSNQHQIKGQAYSVSVVAGENTLDCSDCHSQSPHKSQRLNQHISSLACQTCHIPSFARKAPTKMYWDWSKAGDSNRKDDHLTYLKIKGEFVYQKNVIPEYAWFNNTVNRYILGDKINPAKETSLNQPNGNIHDSSAKIWPFKIHRGRQPYDAANNYLLVPTTSGEGGYWHEFNWDKALRLSEKNTGLPYSGKFGFAPTRMYWPLSHMVAAKEKSLQCNDCHGETASLFDWKALGYGGDPLERGGRSTQDLLQTKGSSNEKK